MWRLRQLSDSRAVILCSTRRSTAVSVDAAPWEKPTVLPLSFVGFDCLEEATGLIRTAIMPEGDKVKT